MLELEQEWIIIPALDDEIQIGVQDLGNVARVEEVVEGVDVLVPLSPGLASNEENALSLVVNTQSGSSSNMDIEASKPEGVGFVDKEKNQVLENFASNWDGLLSPSAIRILDSGCLVPISKVFKKTVVDMEEKIFKGVCVKDVLDNAVKGTLDVILEKMGKNSTGSKGIKIEDMDNKDAVVENLLTEPGFMEIDEPYLQMAMLANALSVKK